MAPPTFILAHKEDSEHAIRLRSPHNATDASSGQEKSWDAIAGIQGLNGKSWEARAESRELDHKS